jgi:hypothetical protein
MVNSYGPLPSLKTISSAFGEMAGSKLTIARPELLREENINLGAANENIFVIHNAERRSCDS